MAALDSSKPRPDGHGDDEEHTMSPGNFCLQSLLLCAAMLVCPSTLHSLQQVTAGMVAKQSGT